MENKYPAPAVEGLVSLYADKFIDELSTIDLHKLVEVKDEGVDELNLEGYMIRQHLFYEMFRNNVLELISKI